MLTFAVIAFLSVPLIIFVVAKVQSDSAAQQADARAAMAIRARALETIDGFEPTLTYTGVPGGSALALDPTSNQFAIASFSAPPRVYRFDQLTAAEIVRDGQTVTTTKGKVDTIGAALATFLAGPVGGLLVGAKTSSTSESRTFTTKLSLKLYVNDLHMPVIEVAFLGSGFGWQDGGIHFDKAVAELDAWYSRFRTIIVGLDRQKDGGAPTFAFAASDPLPVANSEPKGWMARTFGV